MYFVAIVAECLYSQYKLDEYLISNVIIVGKILKNSVISEMSLDLRDQIMYVQVNCD